MRILLFGGTGMLGRAIIRYARERDHIVKHYSHAEAPLTEYGTVDTCFDLDKPDIVINAAGMIPPTAGKDSEVDRVNVPLRMIRANAEGPFVLSTIARYHSVPMIHVSTDCVFSGQYIDEPLQVETDRPDATDVYGRSKALGELCLGSDGKVTVVRCSFIGPRHGLVRWFLDQPEHAVVKGYANAMWSGSTVDAVANGLIDIAEQGGTGRLEHLSTRDQHSKYDVLLTLALALRRPDIQIEPSDEPRIYRALVPTIPIEFGAREFKTVQTWQKREAGHAPRTQHQTDE